MVENRDNDQCGFDAFSAMTAIKKKKTTAAGNDTTLSDTSTNTRKFTVHSKTAGYEVKKITGSTWLKHTLEEKKTGLHAVSIDTDCINPASEPENQTAISIDTEEFTCSSTDMAPAMPIIIDETEDHPEQEKKLRQTSMIKKEKQLQGRGVSVDISSDIRTHELPSIDTTEQLGSGTVVEILGSGGMARVYKIWNEKLEIYRAVKILLPTMQKEQRDRFLTEAKISVKLHHPNIIETYDSGEWHDLPTIEMELIEGTTLNMLITTHQQIPSPVCASIALQIARALAYAHSLDLMIYGKKYTGIIHRDLKPANIMIAQCGRVKLMDFGVARPMETGLHTVVTENIVGTIHYFSPEQIGGYPIDHLTDVYSFGAVLYELLCGKNPFPYSNMIAMVQAKTKNQFRRLEDYPIEMDRRLASVAQTCLRTEKRERYPDFGHIAKVLTEIVASYAMGTPEEIIAQFFKNPELVHHAYQHYVTTHQPSSVPQKALVLSSTNTTPRNDHLTPPKKHSVEEAWEPKQTPTLRIIGIIVTICALLIAGGVFLFWKKSGVPLSFDELINGTPIQSVIHTSVSDTK